MQSPGLLLWSDISGTEFLRLAELAEDCGYSELWYTDIRFRRDCYMDLAVAATRTSRLLLGPGVSDPFGRHPAVIATGIATLDDISSGRAQLGLGSGGSGLRELGIEKRRPLRALSEAIDVVRALLAGDPVHYRGDLFQVDGARLSMSGTGRVPPIFIATHSPQTLELAGKVADGVLLANVGRPDLLAETIHRVRSGEEAAGRPKGSVAIHLRLETYVADDPGIAAKAARRRIASRLMNQFSRWPDSWGIISTPEMLAACAERDTERLAESLADTDVRATALVGTPDAVVDQLRSLLIDGISKVTIRPMPPPGVPVEQAISAFMSDIWARTANRN